MVCSRSSIADLDCAPRATALRFMELAIVSLKTFKERFSVRARLVLRRCSLFGRFAFVWSWCAVGEGEWYEIVVEVVGSLRGRSLFVKEGVDVSMNAGV